MSTSAQSLAPSYRTIVAALRVFRPVVPTLDTVALVRNRTQEWISRWRLPASTETTKEESRPGWKLFQPLAEPQNHVFYLHGGGLVFYSVEDFKSLMTHFSCKSGCAVTAFHYAKAPEHAPDEIINRIVANFEERLAELSPEQPIVLAGDSIGGYIALYLALRRFPGRFARLALIYPVLDLHHQRPSYIKYGRGYCLNADMMSWFQSLWRTGNGNLEEFSPFCLTERDCQNLPPTVVVSAEMDVLRDEAIEWCSDLTNRLLPIEHHHIPNLAHDFCLYAGVIPEARAAVDLIAGKLNLNAFRPASKSQ